ncbi:MAG: STAS domain-containing protein [Spirochaetales bacterium]|nr:STAS domain-containing protein [Spirochaetales bacterium]
MGVDQGSFVVTLRFFFTVLHPRPLFFVYSCEAPAMEPVVSAADQESSGPLLDGRGRLRFPDLEFQVSQERSARGNLWIVSVVGRIANHNHFDVNRKITRLFSGIDSDVILDLSRLEYINSSGVAILFSIFFRVRESGHRLVIGGVHAFLHRVFSLMDLPPDLTVMDSVAEARDTLLPNDHSIH